MDSILYKKILQHIHLPGLLPVKIILASLFYLAVCTALSLAGPPFRTDDPETVDHKHGELYIAGQYEKDRDVTSGTAPHIEFNYGILTDVQFHLIMPYAFNKPEGGATERGYGDTETGIKYRFVNDENTHFMIGTFPIVELPTGDSNKGLGTGHTTFFIPLWLEKGWGPWLTYGGGGFWRNPGAGNKDYWFFGWLVQRDLSKMLSVGTELFGQTKTTESGENRTGFNAGVIINLTEAHHLLFSAGCDFHGVNRFSAYAAYQYAFCPGEDKDQH